MTLKNPMVRSATSEKGILNPYENLLTKMKSPIIRVGIMEPVGMRKGSKKEARKAATIRKIIRKDLASLIIFCFLVNISDFAIV